MRGILQKIYDGLFRLLKSERCLEEIKINQGRILSELNSKKNSKNLVDYEFKVFSQLGEDGIIQFLVSSLSIKNRTFIEFGVEDFSEANCRFLMMKDSWSGYVIDGAEKNIKKLRSSYYYWRYPLQSKRAFISRENICSLLSESPFGKEPGILSIDIDGVDYYVLSELTEWRPSILIIEYNAVFGAHRAVSVPYEPSFTRADKHYSNLYYGASLPAFCLLARERGYALVGVNSAGNNAFFVRRELLNDAVIEVDLTECFQDSTFREARDREGELTFISGMDRREIIADMPLVDVVSGETIYVRDLPK